MPRSPTPSATVRDRSRHEADRGRAELRRPHPRRAHPRIMISEAAAADCNAAVQAVMTHYASTGIPAYRAEEEQCELWLEQLPGDQLRVSGLGHVMDAEGFFGTCRSPPQAGDATTVAFLGKSGQGETTALLLAMSTTATSRPMTRARSACGTWWPRSTGSTADLASWCGRRSSGRTGRC